MFAMISRIFSDILRGFSNLQRFGALISPRGPLPLSITEPLHSFFFQIMAGPIWFSEGSLSQEETLKRVSFILICNQAYDSLIILYSFLQNVPNMHVIYVVQVYVCSIESHCVHFTAFMATQQRCCSCCWKQCPLPDYVFCYLSRWWASLPMSGRFPEHNLLDKAVYKQRSCWQHYSSPCPPASGRMGRPFCARKKAVTWAKEYPTWKLYFVVFSPALCFSSWFTREPA